MASELAERPLAPTPCKGGKSHHWVLGTPTGAETVRGKCKRCKAVREFTTGWDDKRFNYWVGD